MGLITDDDIRRVVSRNAFNSGLEYQMDGRVEAVRATPDGYSIEARVRGSGRKPYNQTIRLAPIQGGKLAISGGCTCPVGFNCKHVAAALLAYREQIAPRFAPPVPASQDRRGPERVLPAEAPLPPEIEAWLRSLEAVQQVSSEEYPPNVRPDLTKRPPGTHKGTDREHHAAFLGASGAARSGFNPSLFSGRSFGSDQT